MVSDALILILDTSRWHACFYVASPPRHRIDDYPHHFRQCRFDECSSIFAPENICEDNLNGKVAMFLKAVYSHL